MSESTRRPQAFRVAPDSVPEDGGERRHRRPKSIPVSKITFAEETEGPAFPAATPEGRRLTRRIRWASVLLGCIATLVALWAGLAFTRLIEDLFAQSRLLGWIGAAVLALAGLAALAIALREIVGLLRLKRLGDIHDDAGRAANLEDREAAARAIARLELIYSGRGDVKRGLEDLKRQASDIISPSDRIRLAERDLMSVLDENVIAIIARHARRVTLVTAVTPAAALDVIFVAAINLRMLREIATLYGGRPGTIGTLRLARMVIGHLAVTGGLALSDNLIQHVIGRGLIGRLSARFGEGAVNGILTARIGLAALDICRPLPFLTRPRPSLALFARELLSFGKREQAEPDGAVT